MNRQTQSILLHITGCLVFLSMPLLFSPESLSLRSYLTNPPTQRDLVAYALILITFYGNFYGAIPRLYFRRKYALFGLFNLGCFALITFLPPLLRPHQPPGGPPPHSGYPLHPGNFPGPPPGTHLLSPGGPPPFFDLTQHIPLFLLVVFLALLLKIRQRWKQTEEEKIQAELSHLKTQINPHFLFNTLNSIYALVLEKSDLAPAAIIKLSEMMRYVLHETGKEEIALEKEIAYITSYIELQQTRFDGSLRSVFTVTGRPEGKKIVPLLLIPFVENAFKYGVNAEENSDIRIQIDIQADKLQLQVINNKVTVRQPDPAHSGLGIGNTRRRLQILYPGKHSLQITDTKQDFSVSLILSLK